MSFLGAIIAPLAISAISSLVGKIGGGGNRAGGGSSGSQVANHQCNQTDRCEFSHQNNQNHQNNNGSSQITAQIGGVQITGNSGSVAKILSSLGLGSNTSSNVAYNSPQNQYQYQYQYTNTNHNRSNRSTPNAATYPMPNPLSPNQEIKLTISQNNNSIANPD